jgi:ABC-2 type transport system permease protein
MKPPPGRNPKFEIRSSKSDIRNPKQDTSGYQVDSERLPRLGPDRRSSDFEFRFSNLTSALAALYSLTLRQHLHGKRWLVMGTLFLLPAILAVVVRATAPDAPPVALEFAFVFMFIPQALLPLVALLYGSGIVQDEQEEQTITYLLIRPIPRWAIYLVKLLATLTTVVVLTAIFTAVAYVAIYAGANAPGDNPVPRCAKAIGIHALTIVAYCCLFGVMSLITKRTLILGFLYTAFFEVFLANLPFSIRLLTILYYSRLIASHALTFEYPVGRGIQVRNPAAEVWHFQDAQGRLSLVEHPDLGMCLTVLPLICLFCMALGAYLCSQREFHVKTPEGN